MKWHVRVECDAPADDVQVFLDGVLVGLMTGIARLSITDRMSPRVLDVEFSLGSKRHATTLAKTLRTILKHTYKRVDARVTLAVDARDLGGEL